MILPISVKKTLSLGRLEKYEIFYLHEQIYDAISKWAPCFPSHYFKWNQHLHNYVVSLKLSSLLSVRSSFKILNTKKIKWIHLFSFFNSNIIKI